MELTLPWLVRAKLKPNATTARLIPRADLRQRLDQSTGELIFIRAPAGYGKTSAMALWYNALKLNKKKCAWVSLDERDRDPYHFLCYIIAACQDAECALDYDLPTHPQVLAGASVEFVSTALLRSLLNGQTPDYIFLDDFQLAECTETVDILGRLLNELPSTKIVVSSRTMPNEIALAELKLSGRATELTQIDLNFTTQHVEAYFGELLGFDEQPTFCRDLVTHTEGWPIALQAIRQRIRSGATLDEALRQASGRSGLLSDYFIEQVFDALPETHQKLLLTTAMLERVNGELANFLCKTDDAWVILDWLDRNDVFVVSTDPDREWFRYHRLFAEFITERARRIPDIDQHEICGRAARWFAEKDHEVEALHYAMASTDPILIAEVLDRIGGWKQAVIGNMQGVKNALQVLPQAVNRAHPRVWLADIYIRFKQSDFLGGFEQFELMRAQYFDSTEGDQILRNEILTFDALINVYCDDPAREAADIAALEQMGPTLRESEHLLQAMRLNLLCSLYGRQHEFEDGIAAGESAIFHYRKVGAIYGEAFIYFHQCHIYYVQGRLRDAKATLQEGLDLSAAQFGKSSDLYGIGAAYAALFAYEENELVKAQNYLEISLPIIERCDAWPAVFHAAYTVAINLAQLQSDDSARDQIQRRALKLCEQRNLPRLAQFITAHAKNKIPLTHPSGNLSDLSAERECIADINLGDLGSLAMIVAYGRRLIRASQYKDAIAHFSNYAETAKAIGLTRASVEIALHSAITHHKSGNIQRASERFEEVLGYAIFEGFKRLLVDEGQAVVALIHDIEKSNLQQRNNRIRDKFVSELLAEIFSTKDASSENKFALSKRERDILKALLTGRTNREIAEHLDVSANTVKFHLKNIFVKLGVSTRDEAARVAMRDHSLST